MARAEFYARRAVRWAGLCAAVLSCALGCRGPGPPPDPGPLHPASPQGAAAPPLRAAQTLLALPEAPLRSPLGSGRPASGHGGRMPGMAGEAEDSR